MSWKKIKLIFAREVRDQLRDRRTIFMIAVLPLLLYPLMGMSFLQIAQFMQKHPSRILVIGGADVTRMEKVPPLFDKRSQFSKRLFGVPEKSKLLKTEFASDEGPEGEKTFDQIQTDAKRELSNGNYEAIIYFPPDFREEVERFRQQYEQKGKPKKEKISLQPPKPKIWYNSASEKSQVAHSRVNGVITRWNNMIDQRFREAAKLPATKPFTLNAVDVADGNSQNMAMWAKILPFIVIIWALTGAFYPAIDLCAGEKERGTLETLLSSPAGRNEIVVGKMATIMLFSMATSILNLISMGITGTFVIGGLPPELNLGLPPWESIGWLLLALVPISAMFSALSLALAAFARSTKEGQYYLMPMILVTMPLVIFPMSPGVELNLGYSLIPVTGVVLLLKETILGNYQLAMMYAPAVISVTMMCCLLAIRWAIDQFNSESVLFRESERMDIGLWLKHLRYDRQATPTVAMAIFCGVVLLLLRFFVNFMFKAPTTANEVLLPTVISQIFVIAVPVLLLTLILTRNFRKTLSLNMPKLWTLPAAVILALAIHPLYVALAETVHKLYPPAHAGFSELGKLLNQAPLGSLIFVLAVMPALCEELAFRGFILSGLRHSGHKWRAIFLSSILFGVIHLILQQSITAAILGVVIGYLCVQAGSIFPCMLFHFTNNCLPWLYAKINPAVINDSPVWNKLIEIKANDNFEYTNTAMYIGVAIAIIILTQFQRLKYEKYAEEELQEAINKQALPTSSVEVAQQ